MNKWMRYRRFFVLMPAVFFCCTAFLSTAETAPLWTQLNDTQQSSFKSLEGNWDNLPVARRNAIIRGLAEWNTMNDEQRQHARERFSRWQSLGEKQRDDLRERLQKFQGFSEQSKHGLRAQFLN